jgi:hypothetical protein
MGGVPRRFPELRFSFLEGGVAWALELSAGLLGHYEKRDHGAVRQYDPREFDLELGHELFEQYARGRMQERVDDFDAGAKAAREAVEDPAGYDFAESLITGPEDIIAMFTDQFAFGCEADDSLNALPSHEAGARRSPIQRTHLVGDIGHWDVPNMAGVLEAAWELVDSGLLSKNDFRMFTFENAVCTITAVNPRFFDGTVVANPIGQVAR